MLIPANIMKFIGDRVEEFDLAEIDITDSGPIDPTDNGIDYGFVILFDHWVSDPTRPGGTRRVRYERFVVDRHPIPEIWRYDLDTATWYEMADLDYALGSTGTVY